MKKETKYSNPRRAASIEGWPWGRKQRTTARFWVEHDPKRGERIGRALTDPKTGDTCATKYTTYSEQCAIVDGDDGRTYLLGVSKHGGGLINVTCGDCKITHDAIFSDSRPNEFSNLVALIKEAAASVALTPEQSPQLTKLKLSGNMRVIELDENREARPFDGEDAEEWQRRAEASQ